MNKSKAETMESPQLTAPEAALEDGKKTPTAANALVFCKSYRSKTSNWKKLVSWIGKPVFEGVLWKNPQKCSFWAKPLSSSTVLNVFQAHLSQEINTFYRLSDK